MKVFKHRNLMSLLYAILLAIPFISIAVRCIYVQSNKNAVESYTDYQNVVNKRISGTYNTSALTSGNFYTFTFITNTDKVRMGTSILNGKTNLYEFANLDRNTTKITAWNSSIISGIYVDYVDLNTNTTRSAVVTYANYPDLSFYAQVTGNIQIFSTAPSTFDGLNYNISYQVVTNGTLDNAFEYSLREITNNNNFGNLDFFQWFTNMFIDSSKANNQLYVGFINWYLNYTLFVSLGYILFLVIMWFIKLVRQILEKGLSFGSGGSY